MISLLFDTAGVDVSGCLVKTYYMFVRSLAKKLRAKLIKNLALDCLFV